MTAEHAYQWCVRRECQRCSDYRIGVREGIQAGYLDLLTLHEKGHPDKCECEVHQGRSRASRQPPLFTGRVSSDGVSRSVLCPNGLGPQLSACSLTRKCRRKATGAVLRRCVQLGALLLRAMSGPAA